MIIMIVIMRMEDREQHGRGGDPRRAALGAAGRGGALHSAKGGAVETGCSGLHDVIC